MTATATKVRKAVKPEPPAPVDEQADGRRLRAERNRDAVVAAVIDIIKEQGGGPVPGASEVAERADVSERTVFRHFADLDSLFIAAAARQRPIFRQYIGPRPDAAELDQRITALVKLRSKLWEEVAPVRRVAMPIAASQQTLAAQIGESSKAAREQVAAVFAPELSKAGRDKSNVLDQLDLLLSWSVWDALRSTHGASVDRARKIVTEMVTTTLAALASRSR